MMVSLGYEHNMIIKKVYCFSSQGLVGNTFAKDSGTMVVIPSKSGLQTAFLLHLPNLPKV